MELNLQTNTYSKLTKNPTRTLMSSIRAIIYLFNVNNRNTRKSCEICSELTIKTPERGQ